MTSRYYTQPSPFAQQPQIQQQVQHSSVNFVQGTAAVKSIITPVGIPCVYFDSENENIFYIKQTDALGRCTNLTAYRFEEVPIDSIGVPKPVQPEIDTSVFVKRDEIDAMFEEYLKTHRQFNKPPKPQQINKQNNGKNDDYRR